MGDRMMAPKGVLILTVGPVNLLSLIARGGRAANQMGRLLDYWWPVIITGVLKSGRGRQETEEGEGEPEAQREDRA